MNRKRGNSIISAWTDVGHTWSKVGRAIGKGALESVADALKKTAQALDDTHYRQVGKSDRRVANDVKSDKAIEGEKNGAEIK